VLGFVPERVTKLVIYIYIYIYRERERERRRERGLGGGEWLLGRGHIWEGTAWLVGSKTFTVLVRALFVLNKHP
jgi:hypothetical protein